MKTYICVTIYFLVYLFATSRSLHLKEVKRTSKGMKDELPNVTETGRLFSTDQLRIHSSVIDEPKNVLPTSDKTANESAANSTQIENPLPDVIVTGRNGNSTMKLLKPTYKYSTSALNAKKETLIHKGNHRNVKDWHGIQIDPSSNGLSRLDVVVVDLPSAYPAYPGLHDNRHFYSHSSSPFHYVPVHPSMFDLFFGANMFDPSSFNKLVERDSDNYVNDFFISPSKHRLADNNVRNEKNIRKVSDRVKSCSCGKAIRT